MLFYEKFLFMLRTLTRATENNFFSIMNRIHKVYTCETEMRSETNIPIRIHFIELNQFLTILNRSTSFLPSTLVGFLEKNYKI